MPGRPLEGGEDDAAVGVVPSVGFVLAHDGELDAVDGQELFEGEPEGHGGEDAAHKLPNPRQRFAGVVASSATDIIHYQETRLQDALRITKQRLDIAR